MAAPWILWRYVARDVAQYAALGLLVFGLLLVVQNVLRFLADLVGAGLSGLDLLRLAGSVLPSYLGYAIPTALLFGVLLAFGRMSADGEIVAMRASGISVPRLLPPVLSLGLAAALVTAYVSFEVEPDSRRAMKRMVRELGRSILVVQPGSFQPLGSRVVYVHRAGDPACPLEGVLIADFSLPERTIYVAAQCGAISGETSDPALKLDLTNGSVHFDETSGERYRRIRFAKMHTELDLSFYLERARRVGELNGRELLELERAFRSGDSRELRGGEGHHQVLVQIHRRLSFSFAAVALAVLAVPLGIRPLRAGRSWGALVAIGLMGLYWVVFSLGELAAERGVGPAWLGVWVANACAAGAGLLLIRRSSRADS